MKTSENGDEQEAIPLCLRQQLQRGKTLGLIGVGKFGRMLQEYALANGVTVLLNDPPRARQDTEDLKESFFELWGNGMGGCNLTGTDWETFLPLSSLQRADVIAIQVPLTTEGPFPTTALLSSAFLQKCPPEARIFCFSAPEVIASDCRNDPRIAFQGLSR